MDTLNLAGLLTRTIEDADGALPGLLPAGDAVPRLPAACNHGPRRRRQRLQDVGLDAELELRRRHYCSADRPPPSFPVTVTIVVPDAKGVTRTAEPDTSTVATDSFDAAA